MSQEEHALDRDIVWTSGLAVSRAYVALISPGARDLGILLHGSVEPLSFQGFDLFRHVHHHAIDVFNWMQGEMPTLKQTQVAFCRFERWSLY